MPPPEVTVTGPSRLPALWMAAAVLFLTSAVMLAVRNMPSNMTASALIGVHWLVVGSFALACIFAGVAMWPRREISVPLRVASVTAGLFGGWGLISPLVLTFFADDTAVFLDALLRIAIGGTAVGCLSRSSLSLPWRAIPAVTFAVVALATLLTQGLLTSTATMDLAVLAGNLLVLLQVAASIVLGVVALRFARVPRPSTSII